MHQPLDALEQLDERAELGQPRRSCRVSTSPDAVGLEELLEHVGLQLLDAQRQALVLGVDLEDDGLDLVALVQHLAGMLDPLGPGQVGDVHQAVDPFLDLDERAEVGDVAHRAL